MAKNILLCFDGTWNTPGDKASPAEDDSTNVFRFFERVNATSDQGRAQLKWYNQGVGTEWMNRVRGGAFGLGLDRHILDGYRKLIEAYQDGDEVFVIGFSRGAYTARSLVGLIRNCGLLRVDDEILVDRAYEIYRSGDRVDSEHALAFRKANSREIRIKFVGVWDTVGALGIPLQSFKDFNAEQYAFHDTKLSSIVEHAFHALAVDEHRGPYQATMWGAQDAKDRAQGQVLEQVWFSGAHADVGGGYKGTHPIADLTLRWMQQKALGCGLGLQPHPLPDRQTAVTADLHDSFAEFLGGFFSFFQRRHYRLMGKPDQGPQFLDSSIRQRIKTRADYRPKNDDLYSVPESNEAWGP
jgi:uncharacterized protein (DUF2235 family)